MSFYSDMHITDRLLHCALQTKGNLGFPGLSKVLFLSFKPLALYSAVFSHVAESLGGKSPLYQNDSVFV